MHRNLPKEKLLAEIERLKKGLKKKKKYGLVWEDKPEDVIELCKEKLPVVKEIKSKEIITDKNKPVNLLIEGDNYHSLSRETGKPGTFPKVPSLRYQAY